MRHPGGAIALEEDVPVFGEAGVGVVIIVPGDNEAAVGGSRNARLVLVLVGRRVDAEFAAGFHAGVVVALAIHARAAAVLVVTTPHHDEATAIQSGDLCVVLVAGGEVVGPELCADGVVVHVVALAVNAVVAAIGAALVFPHHHVAAVGKACHRGLCLVAGDGGIDHLLEPVAHCAIRLRRDVDDHIARLAGAAVAVGDADRHGTAGDRIRHRVGVGQILDHVLDRVGRGVGVELHRQLVAVGAVADDGADGRATVADGVA